jgi:hypothetical protein
MTANRKEYRHNYHLLHRAEELAQSRNWYRTHKKDALEYQRKYTDENREKINSDAVRLREQWKTKVFQKLGNKCSNPNCPIPENKLDKRTLQIDHVHGNGHEEIKKSGSRSIKFLKKVLVDTSDEYQLLCVYCNWVKRYENNEAHR